jgi:hypothetical protein
MRYFVICSGCGKKIEIIEGLVKSDEKILKGVRDGTVILMGCEGISKSELEKFKKEFICRKCNPAAEY